MIEDEERALLSFWRQRYYQMIDNSAVQDRVIAALQAEVKSLKEKAAKCGGLCK